MKRRDFCRALGGAAAAALAAVLFAAVWRMMRDKEV